MYLELWCIIPSKTRIIKKNSFITKISRAGARAKKLVLVTKKK
jgi:hypothetical protein